MHLKKLPHHPILWLLLAVSAGVLVAVASLWARNRQVEATAGTLTVSATDVSFDSATGYLIANQFQDKGDTTYLFDPHITTTSASAAGSLSFGTSGATHNINMLDGGALALRTSPGGDTGLTTRVTLTKAGYLGIGTTTPSTELDVNGTITATTINATTFGSAFESQSAECSTAGCTATATCTAGKVVVFGGTATNSATCDTNPGSCNNSYCTVGAGSCAVTESSASDVASVYISCAKMN